MRFSGWFFCTACLASGVFASPAFTLREVAHDTNAWLALHADIAAAQSGFGFREAAISGTGFLLPKSVWPRRTMAVEADVRMRQRLTSRGWNFAGVALYQDDNNYWMLALVEGPDGTHTVDFLENLGGVWQAQNAPKTSLKRDGSVSFAWKRDVVYRLRLVLDDGRVAAQVSDPADGRVFGKAFFELGSVPSVGFGRPGLIVRSSDAECRKFSFGKKEYPCDGRGQSAVALLDDALPGHDRVANARLAEALRKRDLSVTSLTVEQLLSTRVLTADAFQVLVIPQCDAVPAALGPLALNFAREGGHLVFLGGPFLDHAMWRYGDRWLDKKGLRDLLQTVKPVHRPFEIDTSFDAKAWRRSSQDGRTLGGFQVANEGPEGTPCLRMEIQDLRGWDVRQSPDLRSLFGEGDELFTFMGKGDPATSQLAVEIIERDGSRWIATAPLTAEWRRIGLRLEEFHFWHDSSHVKRGQSGDRLNPRDAVRVCFGLSASHTSVVGPGPHTVWLADIGTAPDPFRGAGVELAEPCGSIETVYPRYKTFILENASANDASSRACGRTVCAITRPMGEGYGRNSPWRFVSLAEATHPENGASGVCEWLLLNNRFPLDGAVFAGFGYTHPDVWSSPEVAGRIADQAARLTRATVFEGAGTEQFAYWPDEEVRLGASVRAFGYKPDVHAVTFQILRGERVVWSESVTRAFSNGLSQVSLSWKGQATPGEYVFRARLSGAWQDEICHRFSVLDPAPASQSAFITARGGDFWLNGKKWYPVGVNFWPLYVSGMDSPDYSAGWLRDAFYSPALVEQDLVQLRAMGINMVSIQTPPLKEYRNLLDFLCLCRKYAVHANLYVGQASPLAFNEAELKAYLTTARLPDNATVFAYDTIWEPGNHVFRDISARAKWDGEWREWISERYGSIENAEKNWGFKARRDKEGRVVSPEDKCFREDGAWRGMMAAYRRFMDNLTSRLWGRAHRRLRELDPNHLISFRQGNTLPYDFALSGPVKHIDFICPEGYAIRDTDEGEDAIGFITRYVDFTTGGKPIVWSEFGLNVWNGTTLAPNPDTIAKQGRYSERFYRTALLAGADGTVPWWWVGGYRVGERSDFGIVGPDRTERPAAHLIREYGPRLKTPRERPQPSVWFEFDRDAHAGGYWQAAFNEGAAAYRAAVRDGKMLGIRTAGTGSDSSTVPLVAAGNVPCDGNNPPKYLDAEFNYLQIFNAEGVWQEADDGNEISVTAGQPVRARASVGNTQEAAWLAGDGVGAVALVARVAGKECGRRPVKDRIPYLGDAAFGEFTLLPAAQAVAVTVRMEAVGRTSFGEVRTFTVRAK